jgi:hypothetical protein
MNGWGFVNDNRKAGGGEMVYGPIGQPLGAGSAQLTLTQSIDGWALATGNHEGTKVARILSLDYSTYTRDTLDPNAIALQLAVTNIGFTNYHRFVFEPRIQGPGAVKLNQWQRWNPTAPSAIWWISDRFNEVTLCTQAAPCTWTQLTAIYYTAATIAGGVWLKAGSGWSAGKFNVDAFVFAATVPLTGVLYDFEPETNND